jgi:signal transduction histidine kinase
LYSLVKESLTPSTESLGSIGSGLGLTIAQQCASILNAETSLHNASNHGGVIVEIRFTETFSE